MENYEPPVKRSKLDPANKQELSLMDINNYCTFKIFDHLNVMDLATIADTNKQLRALAQDHFRVKCGKLDIGDLGVCEQCKYYITAAAKIFRNFGKFISDLSICGGCSTEKIFDLTKKYCKPNTLTHLHFNDLTINEFDMKAFIAFFESLVFLEVCESAICECCVDDDFFVFPETFKRLKSLLLADSLNESTIKRIIQNNFRQLEELTVRYRCEVNHSDFCDFIQRHLHLKSLSFNDETVISSDTIKFIGDTLTQLEQFELIVDVERDASEFCQAIAPFGSIKTLKKFALDCNHCPAENLFEMFVANNVGIEHLNLIRLKLNEDTEMYLKRLKAIRTLHFVFYDHENTHRYISIAKCLPLLSEFHLKCDEPISAEYLLSLLSKSSELSVLGIKTSESTIDNLLYRKMLDIIKNRQNGIGLGIRIHKGSGKIDDEFKKNQRWIRIVEDIEESGEQSHEESDGQSQEESDG